MKTIKIDGKTFKEVEGETPVEGTPEEETPVEETPAETTPETPAETPAEDTTDDESVEEKIDEAAEKIVAKLGLDKIQAKLDKLTAAKTVTSEKKISALMDLETLMKKNVSQMTTKEKIVGFFQAMVQSNHAVLKALSEGTAADGGYLFPKFVGA